MYPAFKLLAALIGLMLLSLAAMGVASIWTTARRRGRHSTLLARGVCDTAAVVDNRVIRRTDADGNSGRTFQAVVILDHQDGAQPVALPDGARSPYVVGTKLDVVYDPADPARVELITRPPVFGYVLGVVFLIVPVILGPFVISALLTPR